MSDAEGSTAPRRSQREKKQTQTFVNSQSPGKRKRDGDASGDDELDRDADPLMDADAEEDDDGGEGDYRAPTKKPKGASTRKPKGDKGPPVAKKPRTSAAAAKPTARRGRKNAAGAAFDPEQLSKESKIANDNPLFNALMNPNAALQNTVEELLESLSSAPAPALADLINCLLRCCGCNETVDADTATDLDGAVDALDNITERIKQEDTAIYPLTSKLPMFKHFRKSLSEFFDRLIASAAELGSLYTSDLLSTFAHWIIPLSSSQFRSLRHTATVIALNAQTALCDVAAAVQKEGEMINKQREGERKKKSTKGGTGNREKEFATKAAEVKQRREKTSELLNEFFDGVFIHRYRDLDPNIRADCAHALGQWFRKHPSHYIDGSYLRYVGWVLSDKNTHVRLQAVKSLQSLYARQDFLISLTNFTERFRARLVEMASRDIELSVRVAVIQVLGSMDGHGLLDEAEQEKLCLLIYDKEAKVRKAVSGFVSGIWKEAVEAHLVGAKASEKDKERVGIKALASLLVKWERALDGSPEQDVENDDSTSSQDVSAGKKEVASLVGLAQKGRAAFAVEALWDEIPPISDWESLLEVLLFDHTAGDAVVSRRNKNKKAVDSTAADELWRLEEVEETLLLEVFVAALHNAKTEAEGTKKGEEETVVSDITRALIKGLPRLIAKHQSEETRLCDVLLIPLLMNLDLYLEMRMMTAYESLWDDVSKQFLSHSSPVVLKRAIETVRHLMRSTTLSNTNSTKIVELEDELATSLRDTVAGRDELEVTTFTDDEAETLAAICARIASLSTIRDISAWMEEDEGGKQSSAWDILAALSDRGRLGYKEEELMVELALQAMKAHIIWKTRAMFIQKDAVADQEQLQDKLREQRETFLERVLEYAAGNQSNASVVVKRVSFQALLDLHILFALRPESEDGDASNPLGPLQTSLDEEVQQRCAGFVEAEIERYAEDLQVEEQQVDGQEEHGSESEGEDERPKHRKGSAKERHVPHTRSDLEREFTFTSIVSNFMRAIRAGVIAPEHGDALLAHYGRLGMPFNVCCKVVIDVLREQALYLEHGDVAARVITKTLQKAFTLVLDRIESTEENAVALAKLLSSCFVLRGSQLSILRKIEGQHIVDINVACLSWIGQRLAQYESTKNKKMRNIAATFFKCLTPLLMHISSDDALKMKAHLDTVLAQSKLEVAATSKVWDPLRAYEKRLASVMAKGGKGPSGTKSKRKSKAKDAGAVTTDDDDEGAEASEIENIVDDIEPVASSRPRPRAVFEKRSASPPPDNPIGSPEPLEQAHSPPRSQRSPPADTNQTPVKRGTKRHRDDDPDADEVEDSQSTLDDDGAATDEAPILATNEVQFRRKRIRH